MRCDFWFEGEDSQQLLQGCNPSPKLKQQHAKIIKETSVLKSLASLPDQKGLGIF